MNCVNRHNMFHDTRILEPIPSEPHSFKILAPSKHGHFIWYCFRIGPYCFERRELMGRCLYTVALHSSPMDPLSVLKPPAKGGLLGWLPCALSAHDIFGGRL